MSIYIYTLLYHTAVNYIVENLHSTASCYIMTAHSFIGPPTPSGVTVSELSASSALVRWASPSQELLGYVVSFERVPGRGCDSPHTRQDSISRTATQYTITGLSGFSTYSINITAVNVFAASDVTTLRIDIPSSRKICTDSLLSIVPSQKLYSASDVIHCM